MTSTIAVIDIGSSAIRLLIAQGGPTDWKILENAAYSLGMGKDIFSFRAIKWTTINRAVEILGRFKELIAPYRVDRIAAIGTSALRETDNWEVFIDEVIRQTGIEVKVLDGLEANQLTWMAVANPLQELKTGIKQHNSLIMEVGAGHTELIFQNKGKIASAHTLPIGSLRFQQQFDSQFEFGKGHAREFFRDKTDRIIKSLPREMGLSRVTKIVTIGNSARVVASHLGTRLSDEMMIIPRDAFRDFMKTIEALKHEEIGDMLQLPWNEAVLLYAALMIFKAFVETTQTEDILVPVASIRQGILLSYAADSNALRELFAPQVLFGARRLAEHYNGDLKHLDFVRKQSVLLYDSLSAELGLRGNRVLLEAAALLHDIGVYIGNSGHHKHGQYIVRNSNIFGLSTSDKELVGHIVRYHRRAKPNRSHVSYMSLDRSSRVVVQKLSALLRVADALDKSHTQRISITSLKIRKTRVVINTSYPGDLSLEKLSLVENGNLFEDVFGLKPTIRYLPNET